MVATADLAIAKAALTAALLRADPNPLACPAVDDFVQMVDHTLDECSRPNVQKCKNWIAANVVPSSGRVATLGKFLVALSESMDDDFDRPSVKRRRLHVLYIVSDVLHHVVVRQRDLGFAAAWDAHLPALVATAAFFEKHAKHLNKVKGLIALWEERRYVSPALTARLRESFTLSSDRHSGTRIHMSPEEFERAKEAPYMMPALHGDPTAHWSDQPAGCWLPHLKPGSTAPMRPSDIRPVPLTPGPASQELIDAVEATLADADAIFSSQPLHETAKLEFNELGEIKQPDDATRRIPGVETYYGWSRAFCNEMRGRLRRADDAPRHRRYRSETRSSSPRSSRSRSPPSPRRRRFSSRSRSPGRGRSRSPGRGRSRSPGRRASPSSSGFRSRSLRNSSYSRSRSPASRRGPSRRRRSYTRSPSHSRSRSGSPTRRSSPLPGPYHDRDSWAPPQPPNAPPTPAVPPQGPGNFSLPPPPPPIGYQGTFPPPPPPPLPPQGWNPNMHGFVLSQMMGSGWGAGPVPMPPPPPFNGHPQHHNLWGRGNGRGGGGRGYRGRGRGGNGRGSYGYGPR